MEFEIYEAIGRKQKTAHAVHFDEQDLAKLFNYRWSAVRRGRNVYALAWAHDGKTRIYMHQLILPAPKGLVIDHINRNGLDNRRSNLRLVTHGENQRNTPPRPGKKYKGVHFRRGYKNPWAAALMMNGKNIHIGLFASERDAAIAYNEVAMKHFPDFPVLNKIDEGGGHEKG